MQTARSTSVLRSAEVREGIALGYAQLGALWTAVLPYARAAVIKILHFKLPHTLPRTLPHLCTHASYCVRAPARTPNPPAQHSAPSVPPVQDWGKVEVLSSGSAEGRYEQEDHPGTEVQPLSALKASNPSAPHRRASVLLYTLVAATSQQLVRDVIYG
jgi:hypothetical protein